MADRFRREMACGEYFVLRALSISCRTRSTSTNR